MRRRRSRKAGSLTLPAKKLYEIVKSLPETDIRIAEDKSGVKVAADRFDSRMQTLPREDFPTLPEGDRHLQRDVAARRRCSEMVAKTQFAITGEDTRYFLNGALFVLRAESMSLVATDGHRLALVTVPREKGKLQGRRRSSSDPAEARRWANSVGCSTEGDGDIQYERGENHLFFDVGGRLLISRMIDGQFPAYERVIPKGNDKRIEFDRDRLTSAVKRVALLSNERSRAVKFQIDKGKVEIASSSPEFGRGERNRDGRLRRRTRADLLQRTVRPRFPRRGGDRYGVPRIQRRSEPGRDEARRRRGLRLHVRHHADENLNDWADRPRGGRDRRITQPTE